MVAQKRVVLDDLHVVDAGGLEDLLRDFGAVVAGAGRQAAVPGVGGFDPQGGPEREGQRAHKDEEGQEHNFSQVPKRLGA